MALDFFAAICVAAAASALACRIVIAAGVADAPDLARKMHHAPTPTSGGVGIAFGFALGLAFLTLLPSPTWSEGLSIPRILRMATAAAAALLFLCVGFVDDLRPLGPRGKMSAFIAAAISAPLLVGAPHVFVFGDGLEFPLPLIVGVLGAALWVFVMVNAVNFMDGANGLALGAAALGLLGLAALAVLADTRGVAALSLCGAGAIAGFLLWNFPHGRLFAGDAGALFAGALAAVGSLLAVRYGGLSPFTPPTLFFPLLADALLTLAWRVGKRPNLLDGHRDHLFQIGLRAGMSHGAVTLIYWRAAGLCALLGVVAAQLASGAWLPLMAGDVVRVMASYMPLVVFAGLVTAALVISARVRRFAAANNLDQP